MEHAEEAQQIVQAVAQTIQQQAHSKIAGVVSKCLSMVFGRTYKFEIVFERKRGKTEAVLMFSQDGEQLDPLSATGGGVVDVASFALRIACLSLRCPRVRRFVVLDEPFKFVSEEFRPRVREMLEVLADEMEFQFVLVTHITELELGTVYHLTKERAHVGAKSKGGRGTGSRKRHNNQGRSDQRKPSNRRN